MRLDTLLRTLVIKGASDIHLQAGSPPFSRINGEITPSNLDRLSSEDIEGFIGSLMNQEQKQKFERKRQICLIYSISGICRFRVNIFKQQGAISVAIRVIPLEIPSIDELELPDIFKEITFLSQGLILVTGPAGSGKSTTLASIIDHINTARKAHIITIEDPIEFIHSNKSCLIDQRCLETNTESFAVLLKEAVREDPDIILVGEMNDLETISEVIKAAESGCLVFTTLHTYNVVEAIDRIVNAFSPEPDEVRVQIREQLSRILRGVIYQTLLRKKDGSGQVAAFEIMRVDSNIRELIKKNKVRQIYSLIRKSNKTGNRFLDQSIKELYEEDIISEEEAKSKDREPEGMK
jgi:twitching motility protein PilT